MSKFSSAAIISSRKFLRNSFNGKNHPCIYKENFCVNPVGIPPQGSPPLARGKAGFICAVELSFRFTPACVGKSSALQRRTRSTSVHPRLRGEKFVRYNIGSSLLGSPPPARGKEVLPILFRFLIRFTPTYVGKSRSLKNLLSEQKVHPRLRGEKSWLW